MLKLCQAYLVSIGDVDSVQYEHLVKIFKYAYSLHSSSSESIIRVDFKLKFVNFYNWYLLFICKHEIGTEPSANEFD